MKIKSKKPKAITEKDCLLEIERMARLIAFSKQDEADLTVCRKALIPALNKVAELRAIKAAEQAEKEAKAYAEKMGVPAIRAAKIAASKT